MARSSSHDPIEKFRFIVTFFEPQTFVNVLHNDSQGTQNAGFAEITIPKANVTEIVYRDNTMGHNFLKKPGLVKYDPVICRRGSTQNTYLYDWYTAVYDDAGNLRTDISALTGAFGIASFQNPYFRKDVLISSVDRTGKFVKHWKLYNAWPISYKGGNDFAANVEEKLIEELVLTYESFLELQGSTISEALEDEARRITAAADKTLVAGTIKTLTTL